MPNPNDAYQPRTGKVYKSDGTVVNEADGIQPDGSRLMQLTGRKVGYQRVGVNQSLPANGITSIVLNVGLGTKAIHLSWKASASISVQLVACDANGAVYLNGPVISAAGIAGYTNGGFVVSEYGGAPYVAILIQDKSASANTINLIDLWTTNG
ncbi:hypothetical protein [Neobacillus sp. NPDC093127]|uniref:hypothetical protein n=1 Tax=Neobacillus sp. NPDC093127 TaxID=3364296 RepID=UPI003812F085